MRQALILFLFLINVFWVLTWAVGHDLSRVAAYGITSILSGVTAVTFLWLHLRRATPLALGMAFSWAGASLVLASWWFDGVYRGRWPILDTNLPFFFVALHVCGAILHLAVVVASFVSGKKPSKVVGWE